MDPQYPRPTDFFRDSIERWEGGWQAMPADRGNWVNDQNGRPLLIGTMRGVTPATYRDWLEYAKGERIKPWQLTPARMQAEITLEVAGLVFRDLFWDVPGYDTMQWSPLIAIAADVGWGSGPIRGIKMLQWLIAANVDGRIGPQTRERYGAAIGSQAIATLCDRLSRMRRDFYIEISGPGSTNAGFQNGWLRRADWHLSSNAAWWAPWSDWEPVVGNDNAQPVAPPAPPPMPSAEARELAALRAQVREYAGKLQALAA